MNKTERINEIFQDLRRRGIIHNKRDFSALVNYNYNNFTLAMKGNEVYLTDKLMMRVEEVYARVLEGPKPQEAPEHTYEPRQEQGMNPSELMKVIRSQQETIRGLSDNIATLVRTIERLTNPAGKDSATNVG